MSVPSAPNIASRGAHTTLTSKYADDPVSHTPVSPTISGISQGNETVAGHRYSCLRGLVGNRKDIFKSNTGLLLVLASQACLAVVNVTVKSLNSIDPPVLTLELIWVRMFITALCSVGFMLLAQIPDPILGPKGVRLLLCLRGFAGFVGVFGVYYSLEYLSLSDATVLTFLAPMCTAIAGSLFLGETFTLRQALAGVVSFVGVVLIARPTFLFGSSGIISSGENTTPDQRLIAVGVALIGVLGATGAYTTIRGIGTRAHALHNLSFYSIQCVIFSTIGMIITKTPIIIPTRLLWLSCLSIIGIMGFIAQVFLTMGLQRETAGRGTMAIYTQIVFAIILEWLVFRTVPGKLSIIGILLILSSALFVALTNASQKTGGLKHLQKTDDEVEGLLDHTEDEEDILPR